MMLIVLFISLLPGVMGAKCGSPVPASAVPLTMGQAQALCQPDINALIEQLILETNNAWTYYGKWTHEQQADAKTRRDLLAQCILSLQSQGHVADTEFVKILEKAIAQYRALVYKPEL